ncbi:MAG: TIGR01212 family radical SAM protein [Calditrichaeota bacterium]|nr:TIGR01212 family radical SAM protein [Calditrichota bacterium]RQW06963.1 MAG: TIGR01212 family radical SAM protein [Calditrichota bacterium]
MAVNIRKHRGVVSGIFPWGTSRRYNAYADYLKIRFGERLQKVIIDAGFTCPNRDGSKGYGGCTYCNNDAFTPPTGRSDQKIREQLESGISYLSRRYGAQKFIAYFQPYSNTYAPLSRLKKLYQQALSHPSVAGLAIGTRPDCVDREKIDYLETLARDHYISIEYGLESPYDSTLEWINRQHDFTCWEEAVAMTTGRGMDICTHIILGFPGETREDMLNTTRILSSYPIDSLKIHHLHIVKKTVLAKKYQEQPFPLFTFPEYMDLVVEFLERLNPRIKVQRLSGETQPGMLIAPQWGGLRADAIQRRLEKELEERDTWQGKIFDKNNIRNSIFTDKKIYKEY